MSAACTLSPVTVASMKQRQREASLLLTTISMGVAESNDKAVLLVTGLAFALILACNLYLWLYTAASPSGENAPTIAGKILGAVGVAGCVSAVLALLLLSRLLFKQIEDMEETCKRCGVCESVVIQILKILFV